jgi:hypothetical protein
MSALIELVSDIASVLSELSEEQRVDHSCESIEMQNKLGLISQCCSTRYCQIPQTFRPGEKGVSQA